MKLNKHIKAHVILEEIALHYGVTIDDLVGKRRFPRLVEPRHMAMYLMRKFTDMSYPEIGSVFNKDHTTVIAAVRREHLKRVGPSVAEVDIY